MASCSVRIIARDDRAVYGLQIVKAVSYKKTADVGYVPRFCWRHERSGRYNTKLVRYRVDRVPRYADIGLLRLLNHKAPRLNHTPSAKRFASSTLLFSAS